MSQHMVANLNRQRANRIKAKLGERIESILRQAREKLNQLEQYAREVKIDDCHTNMESIAAKCTANIMNSKDEERFYRELMSQIASEGRRLFDDIEQKIQEENEIQQLNASVREKESELKNQAIPPYMKKSMNGFDMQIKSSQTASQAIETLKKVDNELITFLKVIELGNRISPKQVSARIRQEKKMKSLRREIARFSDAIKHLNHDIWKQKQKLIDETKNATHLQRIEIIRDELETVYSKLVMTNSYKEMITNMLSRVEKYPDNKALKNDLQSLMARQLVKDEEFETIENRFSGFIIAEEKKAALKEAVEFIKNNLNRLGYSVIDDTKFIPGQEEIAFNSRWPQYKIMMKTDDGDVTTEFVRLVSSENEIRHISQAHQQEDNEKAKEWCQDYENILDMMEENGIHREIVIKREPECGVKCVVDKEVKKYKPSETAEKEMMKK
jgi:hypothetical protein